MISQAPTSELPEKVESAEQIPRKSLTLPVRCGSCVFFKNAKYYSKPCHEIGIEKYSRPCAAYKVNAYAIATAKQRKEFNSVKRFVKKLKSSKLLLLSAMLSQEARSRRRGYAWGQKVYFRQIGDDYLNNYVEGEILLAEQNTILVQSIAGVIAKLLPQSILTEKQFKRKKAILQSRNKINDPKTKSYFTIPKKISALDFMPATFDQYEKLITKTSKIKVKTIKEIVQPRSHRITGRK